MGDLVLSFYTCVASSTVWLQLCRSRKRKRGQDGANEGIPSQRRDDIPGNFRRHSCLCLSGRGPQMRGNNHALVCEETPQDAIVPDGFLTEDIERGSCHTALIKRRDERRLVEQAATCAVHQKGARFEHIQFLCTDESGCSI